MLVLLSVLPSNHWLVPCPLVNDVWQIHICDTKHYRDFIFNPKYKMVKRGGFVEDKVSPVIRKTVERFGLVEGHSRFGCYLLDDASGYFFTGHYDGGAYVIEEDRADMIQDSSKK